MLAAKRASHILKIIKHSIADCSGDVIVPLYWGLELPQLEALSLGLPDIRRTCIRMCPKEGSKDGERNRGHELQRVTKDTGFAQPRGKDTVGCPHCCPQLPH